MVSRFPVSSRLLAPRRADLPAAAVPASPPPTTTTSNSTMRQTTKRGPAKARLQTRQRATVNGGWGGTPRAPCFCVGGKQQRGCRRGGRAGRRADGGGGGGRGVGVCGPLRCLFFLRRGPTSLFLGPAKSPQPPL